MSFEQTSEIGKKGVSVVLPIVKQLTLDGNYEIVSDKNMFDQICKGDIAYEIFGKKFYVEVKTESQLSFNLFLEEWSNRRMNNPGWMLKSHADTLIYYFADAGIAYLIPFHALKEWFVKNKEALPLKKQWKNEQANDTWGYLVPVNRVLDEVGGDTYLWNNGIWRRTS